MNFIKPITISFNVALCFAYCLFDNSINDVWWKAAIFFHFAGLFLTIAGTITNCTIIDYTGQNKDAQALEVLAGCCVVFSLCIALFQLTPTRILFDFTFFLGDFPVLFCWWMRWCLFVLCFNVAKKQV
jgi:hypothetical protein